MSYQQWLRQATVKLRPFSLSPRCDAEVLLTFVSGQRRTFLLAYGEQPIEPRLVRRLTKLLQRRQQGEPIAYLVGEREFWSLALRVTPATLIPRPETELLVSQSLVHLPNTPCDILDLGTGCGAIALALARERPDCHITAVDSCPQAIAVARQNAQRLALPNVTFILGEWFEPLAGRQFSLVVSNPPYLNAQDPHLQQGDVRFEPRGALVAAEDGIADLRHIVQQAWTYLLPGGWLLLEHGWQQGETVASLLLCSDYRHVASGRDLAGHPRVVIGQRPSGMTRLLDGAINSR